MEPVTQGGNKLNFDEEDSASPSGPSASHNKNMSLFDRLSEDDLLEIFLKVDPKKFCPIAQVSKRFHRLIQESLLYNHFVFPDMPLASFPQGPFSLENVLPEISRFVSRGEKGNSRKRPIVVGYKKFKLSCVKPMTAKVALESAIGRGESHLKKFCLAETGESRRDRDCWRLNDDSLKLLMDNCLNLENFRPLEQSVFSTGRFLGFVCASPRLKYLNITGCSFLTPQVLARIVPHVCALETLVIANTFTFRCDGDWFEVNILRPILPNIKHLDASGDFINGVPIGELGFAPKLEIFRFASMVHDRNRDVILEKSIPKIFSRGTDNVFPSLKGISVPGSLKVGYQVVNFALLFARNLTYINLSNTRISNSQVMRLLGKQVRWELKLKSFVLPICTFIESMCF